MKPLYDELFLTFLNVGEMLLTYDCDQLMECR